MVMNKQQISSVLSLILGQFGVNKSKISNYSEYMNDFGFNDADFNLFLFYLERYFGISVNAGEETQLSCVNGTVDYVQRRITC
jgi:acyl carrier protein